MSDTQIFIEDKREIADKPPINIEQLRAGITPVLEASGILCSQQNPLTITVYIHSQPNTDEKVIPTSTTHPTSDELIDWHIHLTLLPKEELTYGTMRAIFRALSRDIYAIKMFHDYGAYLVSMTDQKAFATEATNFADTAPWALS